MWRVQLLESIVRRFWNRFWIFFFKVVVFSVESPFLPSITFWRQVKCRGLAEDYFFPLSHNQASWEDDFLTARHVWPGWNTGLSVFCCFACILPNLSKTPSVFLTQTVYVPYRWGASKEEGRRKAPRQQLFEAVLTFMSLTHSNRAENGYEWSLK